MAYTDTDVSPNVGTDKKVESLSYFVEENDITNTSHLQKKSSK